MRKIKKYLSLVAATAVVANMTMAGVFAADELSADDDNPIIDGSDTVDIPDDTDGVAEEETTEGAADDVVTDTDDGTTDDGTTDDGAADDDADDEGSCEHNDLDVAEGYEPTCEEAGLTDEVFCSDCGEVIEEAEEIEATGHNYEECIVKADATKKKNGKVYEKCIVCDGTGEQETIYYPKKIVIAKSTVYYTGKSINPDIVVKDAAGKDIDSDEYTVSYSNNKLPGKATVTVSFKSSDLYQGSMSVKFTIKLKKPDTPKIVSSKNTQKGTVLVKWKSLKQVTGYELKYTVDKKTRIVKITKASAASYKIKGLKKNKTCSVMLRSYTQAGKSRVTSKWSKSVNTKVTK